MLVPILIEEARRLLIDVVGDHCSSRNSGLTGRAGSFEVRAPEPRELFNLILSNLSGSPFRFLTFSPLFTLLQNYITPVPEGYAIAICNLHSSPKGAMS